MHPVNTTFQYNLSIRLIDTYSMNPDALTNYSVDAIARITEPKNVKLFEEMGVLTSAECTARETVMFTHYVNQVEI